MKSKSQFRIAAILVSFVVAAGAVEARRAPAPTPAPRFVLLDSANRLERSAESLVQTLRRESRGHNPHDRRAVNAAGDLLLHTRQVERALYDRTLTDRRLARMLDDLVDRFEYAESALSRARVSRTAWNRFDRVGHDLGALETVASRTLLAGYRARPVPGRRLFAAELSRPLQFGRNDSLGVRIVYRSSR